MTIMEYFPTLAKIMGEGAFTDSFGTMCLSWLDDNVYAIRYIQIRECYREYAVKNMVQLTAVLGGKWAEKYAVPKLLSYQMNTNYLFRMTPLFALPLLVAYLPQTCVEKTVVPYILNQIVDKVPNIRVNVAKGLKLIFPHVKNPSLQSAISKAFTQLAADSDADVRYFASKCEVGA